MKRKTALYGVIAVILAITLSVAALNVVTTISIGGGSQPVKQFSLKTFSSYEELRGFILTRVKETYRLPLLTDGGVTTPMKEMGVEVFDYSRTNVQVEGVDEADIVKTDGKYAYVISGRKLIILRAYPPEEATVLSRIAFEGEPVEAFISGDKLVVFEARKVYRHPPPYKTGQSVIIPPPYLYSAVSVKVYDVFDRTKPVLTRNVTVSGRYHTSRMIGDYVYMVAVTPAFRPLPGLYYTPLTPWTEGKGVTVEVTLPTLYYGDKARTIPASEIYHSTASEDVPAGFTTVVAVNVRDDELPPTYKTFLLGIASNVYASLTNIYLTLPKHGGTLIYRVSVDRDKIECAAEGVVPGYVLNQFSMDEYGGYFRIATTSRTGVSRNNVYVLNMSLVTVGKLEGIAPEERIYSARFMAERCYLVTFRQVDPFFVIDLKDPENPKVLGYLKIPGYSSYLHPYDDNHVIGIGKEGVNLKISVFDVSDVTKPKEAAKYTVGDEGTWTDSLVLRSHKAFLFDRLRNLLVIPVHIRAVVYVTDKPSSWFGVYVFNISENHIELRGAIAHFEDVSPWSNPSGLRSFYIKDMLYTVSSLQVKINRLSTLEEVNVVKLQTVLTVEEAIKASKQSGLVKTLLLTHPDAIAKASLKGDAWIVEWWTKERIQSGLSYPNILVYVDAYTGVILQELVPK